MGICKYASVNTGNPDPKEYKCIKVKVKGAYVLAQIKYIGCTNFEGNKILLYRCTLEEFVNAQEKDPHFSDKTSLSPIARFIPTDEGWNMGLSLIDAISLPEKGCTITNARFASNQAAPETVRFDHT